MRPVVKAAAAAPLSAAKVTGRAARRGSRRSRGAEPAPQPRKTWPRPKRTTAPDTSNINLDDGIEVGDVFSMKKDGNGKCKIKAPFVDLVVDCDRNKD